MSEKLELINNKLLSSELKVEPLKEGQKVEYRLLRAGQFDPNYNEGKTPVSPSGHIFPGKERIIDLFNGGRPIVLKNITGFEDIEAFDRAAKLKETVSALVFPPSGSIVLDHTQNETYVFCERHNSNVSNPFRNVKYAAVFKKVIEVTDGQRVERFKLIAEAYGAVTKMTYEQLVKTAILINQQSKEFKLNLNDNEDTLRMSFKNVTDQKPELVLKNSEDKMTKVFYIIHALKEKGLLNYTPEDRTWKPYRGFQEKGKKKLVTVPQDANPDEFLKMHLCGNSQESTEDLADMYKKYEVVIEGMPAV